jgi:TolA-binding protein
MRQSFRQTVLVTTAILGFSAVAAIAAPPGAGDPTKTTGSAMPSASAPGTAQSGAANSEPTNIEQNVEQRITDLQSKLQISAAQKPQWDRFTQVMRDNARDMDKVFQTRVQSMDSMNAEANMKSYAEIASHHAQDVQRLVPAFDALYASMSPSQKRAADEVFRNDANQGNANTGKNG